MYAIDAIGLARLQRKLFLEDSLHLLPHGYSLRLFAVLHVVPAQSLILLDVLFQHEPVRETNRQARDGHGILGRHEFSIDSEAALAVKRLARLEIALGRGHNVAGPGLGLARGLAAAHDGGDGDAELEANEVVGLVLGRVPARTVRLEAVLLEAVHLVLRSRLDDDVDAPPQVVKRPAPVLFHARHHLDRALLLELAAVRLGLEHLGQVPLAAGRKLETLGRRAQVAAVGHGRHF